MWDVLIAGAGPAGTVAATILARAGARVLIVDRERFPRSKLCGDSISPGTLAVLRRLNLSTWVETHGLPIDGMLLTGPRGARVEGRYPGSLRGRTVSRRDLDCWLLGEAIGAGAQFEDRVVVLRPLIEQREHGTSGTPRNGRAREDSHAESRSAASPCDDCGRWATIGAELRSGAGQPSCATTPLGHRCLFRRSERRHIARRDAHSGRSVSGRRTARRWADQCLLCGFARQPGAHEKSGTPAAFGHRSRRDAARALCRRTHDGATGGARSTCGRRAGGGDAWSVARRRRCWICGSDDRRWAAVCGARGRAGRRDGAHDTGDRQPGRTPSLWPDGATMRSSGNGGSIAHSGVSSTRRQR